MHTEPSQAPVQAAVQWTELALPISKGSADLVLRLSSEAASGVNGQFLWIEDGLQAPIPSWGEASGAQPWRKA